MASSTTKLDDFERSLPGELLASATTTPSGAELIFPYPQVELAIHEATAHQIVVLGIEVFRILAEGIRTETYSGYCFDEIQSNWTNYVERNNQAAANFIADNIYAEGYGYILTAVSMQELEALHPSRNP